ncbi:MAG: hypothetical protein R3353_01040 [Salegentibacter mishustinae]|nr:hypothetical protein [Salegentibacter mishustinae]
MKIGLITTGTDAKSKTDSIAEADARAILADSCEKNFETIIESIEKLNGEIKIYKENNPVSQNFKKLQTLKFEDEGQTESELAEIKMGMVIDKATFVSIEEKIKDTNKKIENLTCDPVANELVYKFQARTLVKELTELKDIEFKKFLALEKIYEIVKNHQVKASQGGGVDGLRWLYPLDFISSSKDKISIYDLAMKKGGYSINNKEEITTTALKDTLKNTIRVRRFQRFVPEVSVGTAFTFFKYHTYGTVSDSTGQNFVGSPVEKELRNLNITTMVNFNYYLEDSPLHPFYQLGFGVNEGIPTLLTGIGLRSILGIKKFSISAGIAATWIEELNNLEVGDPVSGTVEIEEDLKYQFSWPPKPYIGLQYNF